MARITTVEAKRRARLLRRMLLAADIHDAAHTTRVEGCDECAVTHATLAVIRARLEDSLARAEAAR